MVRPAVQRHEGPASSRPWECSHLCGFRHVEFKVVECHERTCRAANGTSGRNLLATEAAAAPLNACHSVGVRASVWVALTRSLCLIIYLVRTPEHSTGSANSDLLFNLDIVTELSSSTV